MYQQRLDAGKFVAAVVSFAVLRIWAGRLLQGGSAKSWELGIRPPLANGVLLSSGETH